MLASTATNETERSVYRAQWAGAMARLGHIAQARAEIADLRAINATYSPGPTTWILIAEGLADHYESLSVRALDRFRRAYGLAKSFGEDDILRALPRRGSARASSWLANMEAPRTMPLRRSRIAPAKGSLALSRAHLVLANMLYTLGAHADSTPHYARARQFAIDARDISMQSAVLYNVAAFRIARLSLEDALGSSVHDEIAIAELELNSVANLDVGIGVDSLRAMIPLLRAQIMLVKKEWAEANLYYLRAIPEAATYGQTRWESRFLAEQAQCLAMLGKPKDAEELISKAVANLSERIDLDDLAACHARLALCFSSLGDSASSGLHRDFAKTHAAKYAAWQLRWRVQVEPVISLVLHPSPR